MITADWPDTMDAWSQSGQNFLFVIAFQADQALLLKEEDIAASGIRYDLGLASNFPAQPVRANQSASSLRDMDAWEHSREAPSEPHIFWQREPDQSERETMMASIRKIQSAQAAGYSYLANLCFSFPVQVPANLPAAMEQVRSAYRLYWPGVLASFSPETFVQIKEDWIYTFPMKGTLSAELDVARLLDDPKEKAEHHTIVDLLRNDLSQVANGVQVSRFRYLEKIATQGKGLYQTSSEIKGKLRTEYRRRFGSVLARLLPAGSISGAPKRETLQLLSQTESAARRYFTGVAGFCRGSELGSCVLIRFLDLTDSTYRAGAGITVYSDPEQELEEVLAKVYFPVS